MGERARPEQNHKSIDAMRDVDTHGAAQRVVLLIGARGSGRSGIAGALRHDGARSSVERWLVDGDLTVEARAYLDAASLALRLRDVREVTVPRPDVPVLLPLVRSGASHPSGCLTLAIAAPARGGAADAQALFDADGLLLAVDARRPGGGSRAPGIASRGAAPAPVDDTMRLIDGILACTEGAPHRLPPVVVALTKIDRLDAESMKRALAAPDEALRERIGDERLARVRAAFPHLRCVAVSAAGTVRNAVRPVGLTALLDGFVDDWRRADREAAGARARVRRSARVAGVRRAAPRVLAVVTLCSAVALGGAGLVRRELVRRGIWSTPGGGAGSPAPSGTAIAPQGVPQPPAAVLLANAPTPGTAAANLLGDANAALDRGDVAGALAALDSTRILPTDPARAAADTLVAIAALRGVDSVLDGARSNAAALPLIVAATTGAIGRATPGAAIIAPLSLARAGACIGGSLGCPDAQLREDLAWVLLLGTPEQQDAGRRLRAAWLGDTLRGAP